MSVVVDPAAIHLTGRCVIDDAEPLIAALQDHPGRPVNIAGAQKLHLAVVQVLLAARPRLIGGPDNPILRGILGISCDDRTNSTR